MICWHRCFRAYDPVRGARVICRSTGRRTRIADGVFKPPLPVDNFEGVAIGGAVRRDADLGDLGRQFQCQISAPCCWRWILTLAPRNKAIWGMIRSFGAWRFFPF